MDGTKEASNPDPADGATEVDRGSTLRWRSGSKVDTHDVYFGSDYYEVRDANAANHPNVDLTNVDVNSYEPGILALDTTYFWRVDEVNEAHPDGLWKGVVWYFTTGKHVVVDDFEYYDSDPIEDQIWYSWKDEYSYGFPPPSPPPYYPGNGTGAAVGDVSTGSTAEETIVHGGGQSMPYWYTNDGSTGKALYSESERTFNPAQDWTTSNMKSLSLWFYGDRDNDADATEQLYVKVNGAKLLYDGDMNDIREEMWHEWNIDMADFGSVTNVTTLAIGFGNESNVTPGGIGKVYFDDIRLYLARCIPLVRQPVGDLDDDCDVDHADVEILAGRWLDSDLITTPTTPSDDGLVAYYALENNLLDGTANGHDGTLAGGGPELCPRTA